MTSDYCLPQGIRCLLPVSPWCHLSLPRFWVSRMPSNLSASMDFIKKLWFGDYLNCVLFLRMRIMHFLAFYVCISFLELLQQITTNLVASKTENFFPLTVLDNRSPKSRCGHGHAPSEVSRGESFLSLLASGSPGVPWSVAASLQPLPPSSQGFPYVPLCVHSSSLKDTSHWIEDPT